MGIFKTFADLYKSRDDSRVAMGHGTLGEDDLLFPMQELVLYSMLRVVEDMLQGILQSVYLAYVEFDLITLISVIISGIMLLYTTTLRFLEYIYWDYKPVRERQTISLTERCPPVCNGFPCVTDKCYGCIRIR